MLFLEHVRGSARLGKWQDRIQPVWSFLAGGCHPNRNTVELIGASGFEIAHCRYFDPAEKLSGLSRLICRLAVPFAEGRALKSG